MTAFEVSVPAVAQAAARTESTGIDLSAELESLRAEAEAVLAGAWLGRAATSFEHAWSDWHAEAIAIVDALGELAQALRSTASAYSARDQTAHLQLQAAAS